VVADVSARRGGPLTLLVAVLLLVAAWSVSVVRLPLYDGIQLPAQPYRYLHPPPGVKNPGPPRSASQTFNVANGKWVYQIVNTPERPPQAGIILDDGAVVVPPGAKRITIRIQPVVPTTPPPDGEVDGNVYRITAVADNGRPVNLLKVKPGKQGKTTVNLRATRLHGRQVVEQYANGRWIHLQTGQYIGIALFGGGATSFGDFALVIPGPVSHPAPLNPYIPFLVIAALVLAVAGLVPVVLHVVQQRR
jgi:hypothetical protein